MISFFVSIQIIVLKDSIKSLIVYKLNIYIENILKNISVLLMTTTIF